MRDKEKERAYLSEVREIFRETIAQSRSLREECRRAIAKSKAAAEARKKQKT
jgi:hypothetical protein